MVTPMSHFDTVQHLIAESERNGLFIQPRGLTGFSGDKLVGTLQRLGKYQADSHNGCYLEIGVFEGLTLISTALAMGKTAAAYGIDNFCLDPDSRNRELIAEHSASNGTINAHIIDMDYEDALDQLDDLVGERRIGLYFIDGPHDYRSQLLCLERARPYLSDNAIIVVDDSNYQHVRLANRDFLVAHPEFRLFYEAYTDAHPATMTPADQALARTGWWNGVNIMVKDDADVLPLMYPPVPRDRALYVDEHVVLSERYAFLAREGVALVASLAGLRPLIAAKQVVNIVRAARSIDGRRRAGRYLSMNTYSDELPHARFGLGRNPESLHAEKAEA